MYNGSLFTASGLGSFKPNLFICSVQHERSSCTRVLIKTAAPRPLIRGGLERDPPTNFGVVLEPVSESGLCANSAYVEFELSETEF